MPGLFFLENAGRAEVETAPWMGWGKSGVALRLPTHSKACLASSRGDVSAPWHRRGRDG